MAGIREHKRAVEWQRWFGPVCYDLMAKPMGKYYMILILIKVYRVVFVAAAQEVGASYRTQIGQWSVAVLDCSAYASAPLRSTSNLYAFGRYAILCSLILCHT